MVCDHYMDCKFHIHWGKMEYVMPIKCDFKKGSILYIFRQIPFKGCGETDNRWVEHLSMEPVDAESFQSNKRYQRRKQG